MLNPFLMPIISDKTFTLAVVVFDKPSCYARPILFTDTSYFVSHNSSTQVFTVPQGICACNAELYGSLFYSQWQAMYW